MICFLTSMPFCDYAPELNPANGFVEKILGVAEQPSRLLFICSDPHSVDNDKNAEGTMKCFENSGIKCERFDLLDGRNAGRADELVKRANFIFLDGGHVLTQNRFFASINLRGLLKSFDGVLIGFSAGSMNRSETVYAMPEENGKAVDPSYERFLPGLRRTKTVLFHHFFYIVPHCIV